MGRIFIVMGKSATGKDTIYKRLLETEELNLKTAVMYTTRPIRKSEVNGVEYIFVNEEKLHELQKQNKIIEHRSYETIHGTWHYFTVNDGQIQLEKSDYLMIGTLETYQQIREYFGKDKVIPIYIEVEDGIRLMRAIKREQKQEQPKYAEMCRRYLADEEDFSEENLKKYGITKRYQNIDINICLFNVIEDIKNFTVKN
ncbi:guanylate kinase [Lachnospiraceae bacterium MD1]|uniref:Guanylate kinase n=1 Tax=Variimorphobacter saccharofermentans TaxID=2755051 RepID=A0A839JWA7_9FIRM|nr:guanylate kinase [Variimorphobacter saccharofermentans]MBB2181292.1 guanylate kinase [Variimorphobacter saccharofermentans]